MQLNRQRRTWTKYLAPLALLTSVLVAVGCSATDAESTPGISDTVQTAMPTTMPDFASTVEVIRATRAAIPTPTLASIKSTLNANIPPLLAATIQRIRPAVVRVEGENGSGTGIIIETDRVTGIVLTTFHVIEGSRLVDVFVSDSLSFQATIRGVDPVRDLAVLNICCGAFNTVGFADASNVQPGTKIFSLGYGIDPRGPATVSNGIVSDVRYDATDSRWVIESDLAINSGDRGGPMLLLSGEVIGINTSNTETLSSSLQDSGRGIAVSEETISGHLSALKSGSYRVLPTPTPITRPTATVAPSVFDDYGNDRFAAVATGLTVSNSPLIFNGSIETPGDIDTLSFQGLSGEVFAFTANFLLRGSIVTAIGHPKLVLYSSSPSSPVAVDNRGGDLFYRLPIGGTIYLDVSANTRKRTSDYQIILDRIRQQSSDDSRSDPTPTPTPIPTPTSVAPGPTPETPDPTPTPTPNGGGGGAEVILYGVTGDGATTPETLFTIDTATANTAVVAALGNGGDGEEIASDGSLILHASGSFDGDGDQVLETIDPTSLVISDVGYSGDPIDEITGLTYSGGGVYFAGDVNDILYSIENGAVTNIGPLDDTATGLAFLGGTLYQVSRDEILRTLDPATGETLTTTTITVNGDAIDKATALTSHPVTGVLFAVINSTDGRELATIDAATGVATVIGTLGENFAGLAFAPGN